MRRILTGAIFFGLTCVIAVSGYMLAGRSLLDAIYPLKDPDKQGHNNTVRTQGIDDENEASES